MKAEDGILTIWTREGKNLGYSVTEALGFLDLLALLRPPDQLLQLLVAPVRLGGKEDSNSLTTIPCSSSLLEYKKIKF